MRWSVSTFLDIGAESTDSEELRLQKRMLVTTSSLISVAAAGWAVTYYVLDEPLAALIPGSYAVLSLINLGALAATKRYRAFRATQLVLMLALPFFLQMVLGGFVGSSAVILWALMAPFGALVMQGRGYAVRYMVAYGALLIASLLINPSMTIENNLTPRVVGLFFLMNVLAVSTVVFIVMNYFVGQRDRIQDDLELEQERSEELLLNILPEEVAADLKREGRTEAKYYENVSVLFADMVGFTAFADRSAPDELVATLNEIFTKFDEIADRHEIEKIRTIGDAYMAAAGVPLERDDHAGAIARAALVMREYASGYDGIHFRIGISSGPLVAGVVGTSKFQFDIWGDTVNVASRMESTAEPGQIQISETTHGLLGGGFECDPRGRTEVKGKGPMETWYLVGENRSESDLGL